MAEHPRDCGTPSPHGATGNIDGFWAWKLLRPDIYDARFFTGFSFCFLPDPCLASTSQIII